MQNINVLQTFLQLAVPFESLTAALALLILASSLDDLFLDLR